jgi:hypothetical protein
MGRYGRKRFGGNHIDTVLALFGRNLAQALELLDA